MTATVVGLPTKMATIYILVQGRDVTAGALYIMYHSYLYIVFSTIQDAFEKKKILHNILFIDGWVFVQ